MRNWIAVAVAVLALAACGGEDSELLHRHCTVTTATSDEAITFSVCGSEKAEQDWKDQCAIHARGLNQLEMRDSDPLCFCEDAPALCDETGTRKIKHVCPEGFELCGGECVWTQGSRDHCGACGNVCTWGQEWCKGGECVPCHESSGVPYGCP